jgi:hypothetical protein
MKRAVKEHSLGMDCVLRNNRICLKRVLGTILCITKKFKTGKFLPINFLKSKSNDIVDSFML